MKMEEYWEINFYRVKRAGSNCCLYLATLHYFST